MCFSMQALPPSVKRYMLSMQFEEISARHKKQIQEKKVQYKPYKPTQNSRLWVAGMAPLPKTQESRVKIASRATQAK